MKSNLICGDWYNWYNCQTIVTDGITEFVNITEAGKLVGIYITPNGRQLLMIQCKKWVIHKEPSDCKKMTKSDVVLWKLENA